MRVVTDQILKTWSIRNSGSFTWTGSHCSAHCLFPVAVVSVESREAHLSSLVLEAERRAADLAAQAQRDGLSLEACHKDKQLRAWEWRSKLYKRMRTGFQHARESPLCDYIWWLRSVTGDLEAFSTCSMFYIHLTSSWSCRNWSRHEVTGETRPVIMRGTAPCVRRALCLTGLF